MVSRCLGLELGLGLGLANPNPNPNPNPYPNPSPNPNPNQVSRCGMMAHVGSQATYTLLVAALALLLGALP